MAWGIGVWEEFKSGGGASSQEWDSGDSGIEARFEWASIRGFRVNSVGNEFKQMSVMKLSNGKSSKVMMQYLSMTEFKGEEKCVAWRSNVPVGSIPELERSWELTRTVHGKHGGREYHHASISVDPKSKRGMSLSNEELLEMGEKFAEKFSRGHDYAVFVHRDKEHPHCHILINSVNGETGRKLQVSPKKLREARQIKDQVDVEYGMSMTFKDLRLSRVTDKEYRLQKRDSKSYLWVMDLKTRLVVAGESAKDFTDYRDKLIKLGVEARERGSLKKISYSFTDEQGKKRVIREAKLGKFYERSQIEERIKFGVAWRKCAATSSRFKELKIDTSYERSGFKDKMSVMAFRHAERILSNRERPSYITKANECEFHLGIDEGLLSRRFYHFMMELFGLEPKKDRDFVREMEEVNRQLRSIERGRDRGRGLDIGF